MSNVNEQKEIHEISCQKDVDNSELILKGFWEQKQYDQDSVEYDDVLEKSIFIVKNATESIYLYVRFKKSLSCITQSSPAPKANDDFA